MRKNPIPGNPLGEMNITDETTREAIRDRLNLLIGGQNIEQRYEPRYLAEVGRLRDLLVEVDRLRDLLAERDGQAQPPSPDRRIEAAVAALNAFTGYEDNLRAQATEILLGMVPTPVEEAFTALMERAERWNEDD